MTGKPVIIHTDGACSGNPGPGGWGAILAFGDHTKEIKGGEAHTTNNLMELMAAIAALEALKRPCLVDIHTDSQYLRNGTLSWINQWKRNGWRTSDRKPVRNVDLWQRLDALTKPCEVDLHTDSQYVQNGISTWINNWKKNGWRTADKKPVKNIDLWQQLDSALARHKVRWHWVRGHAGHALNERADELAREGLKEARRRG